MQHRRRNNLLTQLNGSPLHATQHGPQNRTDGTLPGMIQFLVWNEVLVDMIYWTTEVKQLYDPSSA
jgi:hypothetical protein